MTSNTPPRLLMVDDMDEIQEIKEENTVVVSQNSEKLSNQCPPNQLNKILLED